MFRMHTSSILHDVLLPDGVLVYTAAIDKLIVISSVRLSNSDHFKILLLRVYLKVENRHFKVTQGCSLH